MKLELVLPEKTSTKSSVLIHQMKSLDFQGRQIKLIERSSESTVRNVTELAKAIIQ